MTYTVLSGVLNSTPTNNWCYIVSLFVSCAFPLTPYSSLFPYLSPHLSFPLRIDPFCFHAGRRKRRLTLCWFHVIVHFFWLVNVCFCRVLGLVFFPHQDEIGLPGETSLKWPIVCWVERKTATQSLNQPVVVRCAQSQSVSQPVVVRCAQSQSVNQPVVVRCAQSQSVSQSTCCC